MPVGADTVRVEIPEPVTLVGASVVVRLEGAFSESPTTPLKPRILVTVMVEMQGEPPATTAMKNGSAEISKSGALTFTVITVEPWTLPPVPAVPVTSTK